MAAPWWLLGLLLLLPLIRWLHRGGAPLQALTVAHLRLWLAATAPAGQGARMPPDPAWRRRALLAALLVLALADPRWPDPRLRVTLWVDDAPAILLRDAGGTRLAAGMARAGELLASLGDAEIELRTLSDPWRHHSWPTAAAAPGSANSATRDRVVDAATAAQPLAAAIARRLAGDAADAVLPGAPPAALLAPGRLHWLLTAGTDPTRPAWPEGREPDRIIEAGGPARNAGLVRLAARRQADDPRRIELLAVLANGGDSDESRTLTVESDAAPPMRVERQLAPGTLSTLVLELARPATRVRAQLDPADALPEDDALELDLGALRPRDIVADAACPAPLRAALAVHPMLALRDPGAPQPASGVAGQTVPPAAPAAIVDCGGATLPEGLPTLRVRGESLPATRPGVPRWSASVPASRRPGLGAGTLPLGARLQAAASDRVLLAFGDEPVIVRRGGAPPVVETSIDFTAARDAGDAPPLLVALMVDELLGPRLLEQVALADRGRGAVQVAPPMPRPAAGAGTAAASRVERGQPVAQPANPAPPRRELGAWLAGAAAIVLGWEIALLARRRPGVAGVRKA